MPSTADVGRWKRGRRGEGGGYLHPSNKSKWLSHELCVMDSKGIPGNPMLHIHQAWEGAGGKRGRYIF